MGLLERLIYFSIGGGIGFLFGYVAAMLRLIQTKVEEMEREVHEVHERINEQERNEVGGFEPVSLTNIMLFVVLVVVAWAAFSTSRANDRVTQTNNDLRSTVSCLTQFNAAQNKALTARDDAILESTNSEIKLWGDYKVYHKEANKPNVTESQLREIRKGLTDAISKYIDELIETRDVRAQYKYDDPDISKTCEKESAND